MVVSPSFSAMRITRWVPNTILKTGIPKTSIGLTSLPLGHHFAVLGDIATKSLNINRHSLRNHVHKLHHRITFLTSIMGDPNHPHQREAFGIFEHAWLDIQQQHEQNQSSRINFASEPADAILQQAAEKLAAAAAAKSEESGAFLYSTLSALADRATHCPASLDMMLLTYQAAAKKLPSTVRNEYGTGATAAVGQLNWWIVEEADCFNPPLQYPQHAGKASPDDSSNPVFQDAEVKDRIGDVLDRVREWRQERVRWTVMSAAMGRCYALGLVRSNDGKNAISQVDAALDVKRHGWSEAQFVGALMMLRGCATSLGTTEKVEEWSAKLKELLYMDGMSFTVKSHSEVSSFQSMYSCGRRLLIATFPASTAEFHGWMCR
jgi:hypothetical protein